MRVSRSLVTRGVCRHHTRQEFGRSLRSSDLRRSLAIREEGRTDRRGAEATRKRGGYALSSPLRLSNVSGDSGSESRPIEVFTAISNPDTADTNTVFQGIDKFASYEIPHPRRACEPEEQGIRVEQVLHGPKSFCDSSGGKGASKFSATTMRSASPNARATPNSRAVRLRSGRSERPASPSRNG